MSSSRASRIVRLSGTVSDYDKWKRFHILFDDTFHEAASDRLNTRLQLESYDKRYRDRHPGGHTSPLQQKYYLVKHNPGMTVARRCRMDVPVQPSHVVGLQVEVEGELCEFDIGGKNGWYIRGRILTYEN